MMGGLVVFRDEDFCGQTTRHSIKYFVSGHKASASGVRVGWMEAIAALLDAGSLRGDHGRERRSVCSMAEEE
jgi:hypothetical protein